MITPPIIAGVNGEALAPGALARRSAPAWATHRDVRGGGTRLLRRLGQAALDLPSSVWLVVDLAALTVGLHISYQVAPPTWESSAPHLYLWQAVGMFAALHVVSGLVFGLYERATLISRSRILTRVFLCSFTVTLIATAATHVLLYATISRRIAGLTLVVQFCLCVGVRLVAWLAVHQVRRGLVVVGSRSLFESFQRAQASGCLPEYEISGYATLQDGDAPFPGDSAWLGRATELVDDLRHRGVSDIVVGHQAARRAGIMDWVVRCMQQGCRVTNESTFYEKAAGQILVDEITPHWFLFADLRGHCEQYAAIKRVFDVVVAVVGLVLTAPLWPLIAIVVKLGDRGPVFYSQDRVGHHGQLFRLYKFRTMCIDAENGRSIWCTPNDPRVTAVGRFLRRSRLDELPQLYNVLVGQMSVVGPRPERPDIVRDLCDQVPYYAERHLVKPGVTGWAQISFRYGSSVEDAKRKLQFDLYYLKHMCFELDVIILLRTLGTFLRGGC